MEVPEATWRGLLMDDINEALVKRTPTPKTHNVDLAVEVSMLALCAAWCGAKGIPPERGCELAAQMSHNNMRLMHEILKANT